VSEAGTIHASAVLVGARAVLIQGPSNSGKSRLALRLLQSVERGLLRFARLVTDDRALISTMHGRILVRPPTALAGLLEIRGVGIVRMPYEPVALAGLIVDLAAADAARLPSSLSQTTEIQGISLPRLAVAAETDPFPLVEAYLRHTCPAVGACSSDGIYAKFQN
jgi:HPr kinase/phosphorylase